MAAERWFRYAVNQKKKNLLGHTYSLVSELATREWSGVFMRSGYIALGAVSYLPQFHGVFQGTAKRVGQRHGCGLLASPGTERWAIFLQLNVSCRHHRGCHRNRQSDALARLFWLCGCLLSCSELRSLRVLARPSSMQALSQLHPVLFIKTYNGNITGGLPYHIISGVALELHINKYCNPYISV